MSDNQGEQPVESVPAGWAEAVRGRDNPYCVKCGNERGGPYGHETSECTFRPNPARVRRQMEEAERLLLQDPTLWPN